MDGAEKTDVCTCPPDVRVLPSSQHFANCPLLRQWVKQANAQQDPRRAQKPGPRETKPL